MAQTRDLILLLGRQLEGAFYFIKKNPAVIVLSAILDILFWFLVIIVGGFIQDLIKGNFFELFYNIGQNPNSFRASLLLTHNLFLSLIREPSFLRIGPKILLLLCLLFIALFVFYNLTEALSLVLVFSRHKKVSFKKTMYSLVKFNLILFIMVFLYYLLFKLVMFVSYVGGKLYHLDTTDPVKLIFLLGWIIIAYIVFFNYSRFFANQKKFTLKIWHSTPLQLTQFVFLFLLTITMHFLLVLVAGFSSGLWLFLGFLVSLFLLTLTKLIIVNLS